MVSIRRPQEKSVSRFPITWQKLFTFGLIVFSIVLFKINTNNVISSTSNEIQFLQSTTNDMHMENAVHDIITVPIIINGNKATNEINNLKIANSIRQLTIKDMTNYKEAQTKPLLLKGWENYQSNNEFSKIMQQESFLKKFGNYTQYIKNQFAQPLMDKQQRKCLTTSSALLDLIKSSKIEQEGLLFFTNNMESPDFFKELLEYYTPPSPIDYAVQEGFHVFSAMREGSFHGFHKHDDAQIYQIHGSKMWWFLPPTVARPVKNNPCEFLHDTSKLPTGAYSTIQQPGDTVYVPKNWWHATCALDDWTVAVGQQRGSPHELQQKFEILPQPYIHRNDIQGAKSMDESAHAMPWNENFQKKMMECGVKFDWSNPNSWTWFQGDLNQYYNKLIESDSKRNPNEIKTYAVHRWMGSQRSTLIHYELIFDLIRQNVDQFDTRNLRLLDAGCGLGAGLMWFETNGPRNWSLVGHTISSAQLDFINKLPFHKFKAELKSYDDLDGYHNEPFDVMYSIEAFIHSPNEHTTLKNWANALADKGIIIIIDDFLSVGTDKESEDVQLYSKSWMSNVLQTTTSLARLAEQFNLHLIVDRDLGSEYQVIKHNYRNKKPDIRPTEKKNHQGWLGSGMRQKLTVEGKLTYRMLVFRKRGGRESVSSKVLPLTTQSQSDECASVRSPTSNDSLLDFKPIEAEHRTGQGKNGGVKQRCISSWYCCGKHEEWLENLATKRTHNTAYLKLEKTLFGDYMEKIVLHLNAFYRGSPNGISGKFLDIGGTGSVASGMEKVTSKFQHFAGPFEYWVLDSDTAAASMENALYCNVENCTKADDCSFDVTFSHTVLEHSPRPWEAFDTIARITKKGGLSAHLVPFSYQYHATPDDNFRFSHKALTSLMEDRGFEVLDVGYDICTKPEKVLKNNVDEHFDVIWLTYIIGKKL